ncbi:MAG: hypothetical protein ABIZ64_07275 [Casimicrobium sp.]
MVTPAGMTDGFAVSEVQAGVVGAVPFSDIPVKLVPFGRVTVVVLLQTRVEPDWVQVVADVPLVVAFCAHAV